MRSKAILMALLALAFGGVEASSVSSEQAAVAVRGWVARRDSFGVRFGSDVRDVKRLTMPNGVSFHAVRMMGGGMVITSGDTDAEPIVAFTSSSDDLSQLDRRSPLWAILDRLAGQRKGTENFMVNVAATAPLASKAALAGTLEASRRGQCAAKWNALFEEGRQSSASAVFALSRAYGEDTWENNPFTAYTISDVRVSPLVETKWAQSLDRAGNACYNYYTPCAYNRFDDGNPENIVCGCVATALAQALRYFEFPREAVEPQTKTCSWNGQPFEATMKGGVYDWSKMVSSPGALTSDDSRQEIGKLTYDASVAVRMDYNSNDSEMSGAFSFSIRGALMGTFGYKSATFFYDAGGMINGIIDPDYFDDIRAKALQHLFYSNLDAGLPVVVGITGHEVVADGYGYSAEGLDYVHINMGWAGSSDYWFLLPVLSYTGGGEGVIDPAGTMFFDDATYNIFTEASASCGVLSGRVLDDDGPVEGAEVRICSSVSGEVVTNVTSGANGIWGVIVPSDTYDVEAQDGLLIGLTEGVKLSLPSTTDVKWNDIERVPTVYYPSDPSDLGNSWGNDIKVSNPAVDVDGRKFATLDRALAYAATNDNPTITILFDVELRRSFTIANACTITAVEGATIFPKNGATLTLAAGAEVTFSNVVFDHGGQCMVDARKGSILRLAGNVAELGEIRLAEASNLHLAGEIQSVILVDAPFAKKPGDVFGAIEGDSPSACEIYAQSAFRLLDKYDEETGGAGYWTGSAYQLRWKLGAEVPDSAVAVWNEEGATRTDKYRSLSVFLKYHSAGTAAIVKDTSFTNYVDVGGALTLYGAAANVTVTPTSTARLTVEEGDSLVISNLTVNGYTGPRLFHVNGGEMTLAKGAVLSNLKREDLVEEAAGAGGVTILESGTFTLLPGAAIRNCSTVSDIGFYGFGGGIYACGGTLNLFGGEITGCTASQGGGVYANMSWGDLDVNLKGDLRIVKNWGAGDTSVVPDNLCISGAAFYEDVAFYHPELAGPLSSSAEIGINYVDAGESTGNNAGDVFAVVDSSLTPAQAASSAKKFVNDIDLELRAEAGSEGDDKVLRWSTTSGGEIDPADARALTIYGEGTANAATNYHLSVEKAFESLTNDATVVVLAHDYLESNVIVDHHVVLRSADNLSDPRILYRYYDMGFVISAEAALEIRDLWLDGCGSDEKADVNPFFDVQGGALALGENVIIGYVFGVDSPSACTVWVSNQGTFRMEEGSAIFNCANFYDGTTDGVVKDADAGLAGAVALMGGKAYLHGGAIYDCYAEKGGGVFVGNDSVAYVSGSFQATENGCWKDSPYLPNARVSNITYDGNGLICLDDVYTGAAGAGCGWHLTAPGSSSVFGFVEYEGDVADLIPSAAKFHNDREPGTGVIVSNDVQALLVWSSAIKVDEETGVAYYEDEDGNRYDVVQAGPKPPPEPPAWTVITNYPSPIAFKAINRVSDTEWTLVVTDRVEFCNYRLIWTDDLTKGFTTTGGWEHAVGDAAESTWTTNVITSGGAWFWRAEGAEGTNMVPPQIEK